MKQKEVSEELAARTKLERNKQDEVRTGSSKRKSSAAPSTTTVLQANKVSSRQKRNQKQTGSPTTPNRSTKKEKLYCICRFVYQLESEKCKTNYFFCVVI